MTTRRSSHGSRTRRRAGLASRATLAGVATLLCGVFGLGVVALSSGPSGAATSATLFVDNVAGTKSTGCSGAGANACKTIQEGVTAAELLTGTAVTLDVAGSATAYDEMVMINVTSGSGDSLDIEGTGSTLPTLNDGGTGSNFTIPSTSAGAVTIDNMTISGGDASTGALSGGAIFDIGTGTLSVGNDTFSDNQAGTTGISNGAAIDAADGCHGGTSGTLIVTNSTFVGNSGGGDGGAIDAQDFCGTRPSGTLTVTDSTFQSNTSDFGGGIAAWNDGSTVTNSTFVSNSTSSSEGGAFGGEGVAFVDDTLTGNSNETIFTDSGVSVANSILHDAPAAECNAAVTDGGHNVSDDSSCGLGGTSVSNSTTIGTLTLAANGSSGPQTAAITRSSSAFGIVPLSACTVNTDERGQPRPGVGFTACDAGAYETQMSTGYDLAGSDGGVFVFPVGQPFGFFGSLPGLGIKVSNVVGLVPTNNFHGYDLAGSDGGVFVFPVGLPTGFYGSLPGLGVKVSNIAGLVATNNNQGYNLVGSDGGVFVFPTGQSAGFYGSLPGLGVHTNDIVGIVEQPDGLGYLLVGRDGGVFAFGSGHYYGSLPGSGISVNNIVGIAPTFDGKGYYLVGSNGAVYPFGDAVDHGSLPALGVSVNNIVGIVPTADRGGYWLIGSDGGVFAFGDAGFIGSLPGLGVKVSNVVGAVPTLF
ncbi:MAG TPA: choice-of-anchor Q domain-containing protein [Acidimicrobiales bacterium]|nr:choice-of-anchor Q domain-containing protein [Acidimicrobiales bacterium]